MTDWKTYKGLGPWSFAKSQADNRYNIGDKIVSSKQPVWSILDSTGIPVTDRHDPCGIWTREYVDQDYDIPDNPPVIDVTSVPPLDCIAWTPNYGGSLGRFVGFFNYAGVVYRYHSDNGGYAWSGVDFTAETGIPINCSTSDYTLAYFHDIGLFVVQIAYNAPAPIPNNVTFTSVDGVNWTEGTWKPNGTGFAAIGYNKDRALFFGPDQDYYGNHLWTSPDALNWTIGPAIGLYNSYRGVFTYNGESYYVAYNYSNAGKSDLIVPITHQVVSGPWGYAVVSMRGQIADNGSVYVYDRSFFAGGAWYPNNVDVTKIDYNPGRRVFAANSRKTGTLNKMYLSVNGIDWITVTATHSTLADLAVGHDRVVTANSVISGTRISIVMLD